MEGLDEANSGENIDYLFVLAASFVVRVMMRNGCMMIVFLCPFIILFLQLLPCQVKL